MKEYDVIAIGSGSSMNIISAMMQQNPDLKAAVIDKDEPGGICLTRGCIPTKMLVYPAELIRSLDHARELGLNITVGKPNFGKVMARMREHVLPEIEGIRRGLSASPSIDYYTDVASFTAPYKLRVGDQDIAAPMIFLCLGSEVMIPPIKGLDKAVYHTSDTILGIRKLPESIAIVGGGYIAAEYGHFFSAMGSRVIIIGRNPQFLPGQEPEISRVALREMSKHMTILTDHEVIAAKKHLLGKKDLIARNRASGKTVKITADEILIAGGRGPNTRLLHPERAGIEVDVEGWIKVDEHLQTTQPNVWAFGDAVGKHLFKHVANYESMVVFYNAILKRQEKVDYHAVPYAVFTYPEVAGVGMGEKEAVEEYGGGRVLIGTQRYEDTAKGSAMAAKDYFVKVIVDGDTERILGAHIVGPHASILIQEIINLMNTEDGSWGPIRAGMHIHPALSEVVERAFGGMMPAAHSHGHGHGHGHDGHEHGGGGHDGHGGHGDHGGHGGSG